jgi:hypothetical protein
MFGAPVPVRRRSAENEIIPKPKTLTLSHGGAFRRPSLLCAATKMSAAFRNAALKGYPF